MELNSADHPEPKALRLSWEQVTTAIAILPLAYTAVRYYLLADGDRPTFVALLAGINPVSAWVSTIALTISTVLPTLLAGTVLYLPIIAPRRLTDSEGRAKSPLAYPPLAVAVYLAASWIADPEQFYFIVLGALVLLLCVGRLLRRREPVATSIGGARPLAALIFSTFIAYFVVSAFDPGSVGLPLEYVKMTTEPEWNYGFVLGVDDTSLTLVYRDGGIRRLKTDDVDMRITCPHGRGPYAGVGDVRDLTAFFLRREPTYVAPECDQIAPEQVRRR